ncbi:OmpW family protein [Parasphingopyxis algicola]|uniref:OmpW/AlkL family protein n=1 Tax=Parasphingopyxis algicola TaxID=2026624 RepID=UPI0015A0F6A1|nr:OmpW family outer membrane protein [Parasphingopyxis algicola]QLC25458.1 OmpW family protein [Parasphingopyxis algicola]
MKLRHISAWVAAALMVSTPAVAQQAGDVQLKLFATGVLPDGEIDTVERDDFGLPAGSQTRVTDSFVPTIAAEYFISDTFSIETICCVTPHDVEGTGALAGVELIDDAIVLPATVTAKLHLPIGEVFKPYIGAGPAYFFIFSENVGAGAAALGIDDVSLSSEFGVALQAGADFRLNDRGLGLSIDAKRYFVGTTATFSAGGTELIRTDHDLDPWVVSAGLTYRF